MMRLSRIAIVAAVLTSSTPAVSATHYLVREWFQNGNQMCEYSNGVVLNRGARTCPLSIRD